MSSRKLEDKSIEIKGKQYVQVKDRLNYLAEEYEGEYSVETNYEYFPTQRLWVVKATLTIKDKSYTGLAQEVESDDYKEVNSTSALENCETSAVGRACAMAGIGVVDSIASVDEMNKAKNSAKPLSAKQLNWLRQEAKNITGDEDGEDLDSFIEEVVGHHPQTLGSRAVMQAVNKLRDYKSALDARADKRYKKLEDAVVVTEEDIENLDKGELPY